MPTNEDLLKEIDDMLISAERKVIETDGKWITVCRGQVEKKRGTPTVIILRGRKKARSRTQKEQDHLSYSHYIDKKSYLGIMMIEDFERIFLTTIKPNRYMYIKLKFSTGKNRKPRKKKK
jgi:hypothetical protein